MTKTKSIVIGISIVTGLLIARFLSGKIIENPYQGTPKGGLFAMTGIGFILITMFAMGLLINFLNRNITVLRYQDNEFEKAFGSRSLPCIFIFDKQFQLVKHFDGAVTARTLIKYTRAAKI